MHSILSALLAVAAGTAGAQQAAGPSVRDVVEFKRIIQPVNQNDAALPEHVSPDGKRAFILTRQADVASDKNRYEILLLDMRPNRLAAQRVPSPEIVLSVTPDHDSREYPTAIQNVQWHGDRTLVFLGRLKDDTYEVYSLDIGTRKLVQLTHETSPILSYAASQDLRRVVYSVQVPNPPLKPGARSVVVGTQSFWGVKFGQHDLPSQDPVFQYFVADAASPRARPLGAAFPARSEAWPLVSMSPDGRWAVLPRWEPERQATWVHDYPAVDQLSRSYSHSQQLDPLSYFSAPTGYVPRRMTAWRLDDGKEQTILDAPDDAQPGAAQFRADRLWQGTGESVVLAGTYLPLVKGSQESPASYVIEYWPQTGRWVPIAKLKSHLEEAHALPGGFMVKDGETRREFHLQAGGGWRESSGDAKERPTAGSAWTLHIAQGLNQPPDVYAVGPAGESRRLTALNPQFKPESWGAMQPYTWRDAKGVQWDGGLLTGGAMDSHKRYPLLIETYGYSPDRFFLAGGNANDGATSAFAGRAFLREGILVLQMPFRPTGTDMPTPAPERWRQQAFNDGVRGAIDTLVKEGRVDPDRVGIIGWSATGRLVLGLVTFDDLPIRAATLADGDTTTLFDLTLIYGRSDGMLEYMEQSNDGVPFGDRLSSWVRNDSSLHTDCVHAAMRIETYGPWVLGNWDTYALLRRQYKAAEMVVIPDEDHALSMPSDRMVSLQGNVDWYAFWLAGKTRTTTMLPAETTTSLATQYANWRQMEDLKTVDDARPRCVR